MGRPKVTEERANQILDAFEECVTRHGLEGTTLQHVADRAGLTRSLIRHHVGNREELLAAWAERAVERYRVQMGSWIDTLPDSNRARALVTSLFDQEMEPDRVMDLVVATGGQHDEVRRQIAEFLEEMIRTIADELQASYPHASEDHCLDVSGGLAALSMTVESLKPLGMSDRYTGTWSSVAQRLVDTLEAVGPES